MQQFRGSALQRAKGSSCPACGVGISSSEQESLQGSSEPLFGISPALSSTSQQNHIRSE